jgi:hypothetical protein
MFQPSEGGTMRQVGRLLCGSLMSVLAIAPAWSGDKRDAAPPLSREHQHPSGAFTFRTPEEWRVVSSPADPNALEAGGGDLLVRFLYRATEAGYDSLHATCMMERLATAMATDPGIKYEYDYLSRVGGGHRSLDSAFEVRYDVPIQGHRAWRQRNLTVVGEGHSLCIITYAPLEVWKKSPGTRTLLDGVLASVTFR